MTRVIIQQLLLFALPFIGYFFYRFLIGRGSDFVKDTPWFALTLTGLALSVIALVALGLVQQGDPGGVYVPPALIDGQIVPGHVDPPPVSQ